jgi:hypothetical protein
MEKKLVYGFGGDENQAVIGMLNEKCEGLDICFVLLETEEHGGLLSEFAGRDIVKRLLREGESRAIVMLSVIPLHHIRKLPSPIGEDIEFLLSHDEVRFFDIAEFIFRPEESSAKLRELLKGVDHSILAGCGAAVRLSEREVARCLGEIRHAIQRVEDPRNPEDDEERRRVGLALLKAREYFPSLLDSSDDDVLDFIAGAEVEIPLVMEGAELPGVFCDIDGTLLSDGKPKADVLATLAKYEAEGMLITVWTRGDVSETARILSENGIAYPLRNKLDFAGATVEIAIDDEDRNSFFLNTRVHAKRFIRV